MTSPCPHCYPIPGDPKHHAERMDALLLYCVRPILALSTYFPKSYAALQRGMLESLFFLFQKFGMLRNSALTLQDDITNRTWLVLQEAQHRGLTVTRFFFWGRPLLHFRIHDPRTKKSLQFEVLPSLPLHILPLPDLDDKEVLKQILRAADLPFAEGRAFFARRRAFAYGKKLGYPLIVKPRTGSHSKHTTINIQNDNKLLAAIDVAKRIALEIIVERFIAGDVYRVLMVDREVIAVARRMPPSVTGDGVHTILELVAIKNKKESRAPVDDNTATLHVLQPQQGVSFHAVPAHGQHLVLGEKVMLANGADIVDCTDELHLDTAAMFVAAFNACNFPVIGFDFICNNIAQSYRMQESAIIEANTLPFLDMHHFPTQGKPRDAAAAVIAWMQRQFFVTEPPQSLSRYR